MLKQVLATLEGRKDAALTSLKEFLTIPSVSAKPDHAADCRRCAQWVADQLEAAEFKVSVMETGGHPAVVAKNKHVAGRPTVLLYGHYDVQPPEPLELWTTPAFEPTIRKTDAGTDAVYARGAVDDKGQVYAHLEAITAWQAHGGLPVNLTVLIEGEEEIGSANLEAFIRKHKDALKADIALISDTGQYDRGIPALTYSLRGLVYEEIFLTGPSHDLHSGGYGGFSPNPANALAKLIASLHDENGKVNLPGFYDDIETLSAEEKTAWAKLPFKLEDECKAIGIPFDSGEKEYSVLERLWARPTCDVNGLTSGYQAHGAKTVLPSKASAKLSFRLVPGQDPQKILAIFRKTMAERCPKNIKIEFENHGASPAAITPINTPGARLAVEALKEGFGHEAVFVRGGGSIPVVGTLKKELGIDTLLVGFGLPDDRVHSPNEKFDLDAFYGGIRTAAIIYEKLAKLK